MTEAIHCFDRGSVRFAVQPDGVGGPRILAEITEHALRDVFGARGGPQELLDALQAHAGFIESVALAYYRRHPSRPVQLATDDFSMTAVSAPRRVWAAGSNSG